MKVRTLKRGMYTNETYLGHSDPSRNIFGNLANDRKISFFDSRALTIPVSLLNFLKELKRETKNGEQAREKITDRTKV